MRRTLWCIDGVGVPRKIYDRRRLWGERADSVFTAYELSSNRKQDAQPRRERSVRAINYNLNG